MGFATSAGLRALILRTLLIREELRGHVVVVTTNMLNGLYISTGVSNFDKEQLQELQRMATVQLAVVQSHCDPFAQARQLRAYCRLAGIQFQVVHCAGYQSPNRSGLESYITYQYLMAHFCRHQTACVMQTAASPKEERTPISLQTFRCLGRPWAVLPGQLRHLMFGTCRPTAAWGRSGSCGARGATPCSTVRSSRALRRR